MITAKACKVYLVCTNLNTTPNCTGLWLFLSEPVHILDLYAHILIYTKTYVSDHNESPAFTLHRSHLHDVWFRICMVFNSYAVLYSI